MQAVPLLAPVRPNEVIGVKAFVLLQEVAFANADKAWAKLASEAQMIISTAVDVTLEDFVYHLKSNRYYGSTVHGEKASYVERRRLLRFARRVLRFVRMTDLIVDTAARDAANQIVETCQTYFSSRFPIIRFTLGLDDSDRLSLDPTPESAARDFGMAVERAMDLIFERRSDASLLNAAVFATEMCVRASTMAEESATGFDLRCPPRLFDPWKDEDGLAAASRRAERCAREAFCRALQFAKRLTRHIAARDECEGVQQQLTRPPPEGGLLAVLYRSEREASQNGDYSASLPKMLTGKILSDGNDRVARAVAELRDRLTQNAVILSEMPTNLACGPIRLDCSGLRKRFNPVPTAALASLAAATAARAGHLLRAQIDDAKDSARGLRAILSPFLATRRTSVGAASSRPSKPPKGAGLKEYVELLIRTSAIHKEAARTNARIEATDALLRIVEDFEWHLDAGTRAAIDGNYAVDAQLQLGAAEAQAEQTIALFWPAFEMKLHELAHTKRLPHLTARVHDLLGGGSLQDPEATADFVRIFESERQRAIREAEWAAEEAVARVQRKRDEEERSRAACDDEKNTSPSVARKGRKKINRRGNKKRRVRKVGKGRNRTSMGRESEKARTMRATRGKRKVQVVQTPRQKMPIYESEKKGRDKNVLGKGKGGLRRTR
jgi:hypothetical protein